MALGNFLVFALFITLMFIVLFVMLVPIGALIMSRISKIKIPVGKLIGMRLRKVPPGLIVKNIILASKAGIEVEQSKLEAHYLSGGNVDKLVHSLLYVKSRNIPLSFEKIAVLELAGKDVVEIIDSYSEVKN